MEERRRRDALDAQKRKAARAEAEHLEDLARLWEVKRLFFLSGKYILIALLSESVL